MNNPFKQKSVPKYASEIYLKRMIILSCIPWINLLVPLRLGKKYGILHFLTMFSILMLIFSAQEITKLNGYELVIFFILHAPVTLFFGRLFNKRVKNNPNRIADTYIEPSILDTKFWRDWFNQTVDLMFKK